MTKEEKDKLIALSDLNREDNIKYISSEAQGIAITLDSDRYAPTFCKLERAYICGRRKSEERIAELDKENAELNSLKDVADLIRLNNSHIIAMAQLNNNNVALRKENAELKENLAFAKATIRELQSCISKFY